MKSLLVAIGRITYWLGWPVSFVSLYFSKRTRVLIVHKDEVLVVKSWLGSGDWHAPGGGIHKGENPRDGARREVFEEVGIAAKNKELIPLFQKRVITRRRFRYDCFAFAIVLDTKPKLKLQTNEIIDSAWLPLKEIREEKAGKVTREMLDAWEQQV